MKVPRVVVVGSSNTDLIVQSRNLPRPGETVLGGDLQRAAGGKGANQAVAARRAGAETRFVAKLGDDDFGREMLKGLRKEGIKTANVSVKRGAPSGVALILLDVSGENLISVAPGANLKLEKNDLDRAEGDFDRASVALFQLESPMPVVRYGLELAKEAGCLVILNPAPVPKKNLPKAMLKKIDIFTPNTMEAESLTGIKVSDEKKARQAADRLVGMGIKNVLITLGKLGVIGRDDEGTFHIRPLRVRPVDTVGAGDAFNGALACAIAEGKDLREAARFAAVAGGIAVTLPGAQPSMPSRRQILSALREL